MRGLYIHIPFCNSVCIYCDFCKIVTNELNKDKYLNRLIDEIDAYQNELKNIDTIYIGGGTPNSLSLIQLEKLFNKIDHLLINSKENTIELNPELINKDLILLLKKYHFNRISIGVETFNDEKLKLIHRKHTKEEVFNKIKLIKDLGINNVNIDLIFGLPYQNIDDIKYDLECFRQLNIPHLSYYNLILEDKTILNKYVNEHKLSLLDDEVLADMYDYINNYLHNLGYNHYEISNYAKAGYESIHNLKYWQMEEYVGLGMSAAGFINYIRYKNNDKLDIYLNSFIKEKEKIKLDEQKREYVIFGLRKIKGISISTYQKLYNSNILEDFNFNKYIKNGIIIKDGDYLRIREDKLFVSNLIIGDLI